MKGKKILALASIFAGVALVGTTFAAWAITDNAPTKHIKISGGKISADTTTTYVTLEYGENTALADVANLEVGSSRYAGKAGLVATYTGATSYKGKLSLAMSQAAATGSRLIDFLKIDVYTAAPTYDSGTKVVSAVSGSPIITLNRSTTSGSYTFTDMTSGSEQMVYFVVTMNNSYNDGTQDINLDASILANIKSQLVDCTVDWDHEESGQKVADSVTVYYKPSISVGDKVYCYAFKGAVPNAEYPGLEMSLESDGCYSYTINTEKFDSFILSYGHGVGQAMVNTKARATDFSITEVTAGTADFYNGSTWTTRPAADPSLTADYYIVGSMSDSLWACKAKYALTVDTTVEDDAHNSTYKATGIALTAGDKIKVRNNSNRSPEEWYQNTGTWEGCGYTIDGEGNLVISATGTYTVTLYRTSNYNNHVILAKTA